MLLFDFVSYVVYHTTPKLNFLPWRKILENRTGETNCTRYFMNMVWVPVSFVFTFDLRALSVYDMKHVCPVYVRICWLSIVHIAGGQCHLISCWLAYMPTVLLALSRQHQKICLCAVAICYELVFRHSSTSLSISLCPFFCHLLSYSINLIFSLALSLTHTYLGATLALYRFSPP